MEIIFDRNCYGYHTINLNKHIQDRKLLIQIIYMTPVIVKPDTGVSHMHIKFN